MAFINRLVIIGVGLIGGSLARTLREANAVNEIIGCGLERDHLQEAIDLGVLDKYEMDASVAIKGADVIVVAAPVGAMESIFASIKNSLTENMVLTDVGSTKASVIAAAQRAFGEIPVNFVPAHPIAGTEKSGVDASFAGLFHHRRVVVTPLKHTSAVAIEKVRAMWECTGAKVSQMDFAHHDDVLAATSHLPHLLAFSLVDTLAAMDEKAEIFEYAAGGFRDFTRIASSNPQMWHDICLNNKDSILTIMQRFQDDLQLLKDAIENKDSDYIMEVFTRAKIAREQFSGK